MGRRVGRATTPGCLTRAPAAITVDVHEAGSHLPALRGPTGRAQSLGQWLALRAARRGAPAAVPYPVRRRPARPAAQRHRPGLAALAAAGRLAARPLPRGPRPPGRDPPPR